MKKILKAMILAGGIVLGGATTLLGAVINITAGSTTGYTMTDGNTYVVQDSVSFTNVTAGGSGMSVAGNATVVLYVPAGVTLKTAGANGSGKTGGGAGIRVPATSTLVITGGGTIMATGGNGGNGGSGAMGGNGTTPTLEWYGTGTSGVGGSGGNGGGGGGAAIGGVGGTGGGGGSGAVGITKNNTIAYSFYGNGKAGSSGQNGTAGESMGNVCILGNINFKNIARSFVGEGGTAGNYGTANTAQNNNTSNGHPIWVTCCGGGGGGGGGAGCAPSHAIGGGGSSGGGGGGGGSGALHGSYNLYNEGAATRQKNVYGGGGTGGQIKGQSGATNFSWSYRPYQNYVTVTGGLGGKAGAAGAEGGLGTLWVSPTALVDVERATLTATTHSAAEYTITFDANGGQFTTSDRSLTATLGCKLPDCIPAPTRSQHVFRGWKTADGVEYYGASGSKSLSSYPVAGDVTLYAEWAFKT